MLQKHMSVFSVLLPIAARWAKLEDDCDHTVGAVRTKMVLYIKTKVQVKSHADWFKETSGLPGAT